VGAASPGSVLREVPIIPREGSADVLGRTGSSDASADPTAVSGGLERSGGIEMGAQGTVALPRGVAVAPRAAGHCSTHRGRTSRGGIEMGRWGASGPWGDVRLEQDPFFGTVEGCVVRLLH
jgi:hypothetical protein